MIHLTVDIDYERIRIVRPRRTAAEHRTALAEVQTTARDILAGRQVVRSESPRQMAKYGKYMPTRAGLRFQISFDRTYKLGQKLRIGMVRGEERRSFIERRREMRADHYATGLRRRRTAHTRRTI